MATSAPGVPFDMNDKEWKMPGYTGFLPGVQETYKKTPIMSQLEVKAPGPESFIFTRTQVSPKGPPAKDPKTKKEEAGNLFPSMQDTAVQPSMKPPPSTLALGDQRIDVFRTSYGSDFRAPFTDHERLRSPNRNEDLAKTTASLKDIYLSAYNRVGEKRLQKIISTMRERLEAKMGNQNNNAFKFRKLFQMYDANKTGHVHYEDFRNMAEQFGMQLDDDSLLALFYVYDPDGTGYLAYHDLTQQLMDPDCYALYSNDVDGSQSKVDEAAIVQQLTLMQKKFGPAVDDLAKVLKAFDSEGTGLLSTRDLFAGCAGLGLVLTDKELSALGNLTHGAEPEARVIHDDGRVKYMAFISLLSQQPGSLQRRRTTRDGSLSKPSGVTSPTVLSPGQKKL